MSYKIFELVRTARLYEEGANCYVLVDLNQVYDNKEDAIEKIERVKQFSFSSYTVLEIF